MSNKVSLTCFGGVGTVTGANFLLQVGDKKFLIDCGLFQGLQTAEAEKLSVFDYDPTTIEALFVTHAHIDHIGRILELLKAGFKGVIYSTAETKEIAKLMLEDLAHITNEREIEVGDALRLWQVLPYRTPKDFGDFSLELFNAGHILGSAMFKMSFSGEGSILFSGDIGNSSSPIQDKVDDFGGATYILMDSVYGDRNHISREERDTKFKQIIKDVVGEGGTLLIPVFSLERSQIIINELDKLFNSKEVRSVPVFLDSPLAIRVTDIYRRVYDKGVADFDFNKLKETAEVRDSIEIGRTEGPKIILAGSGMSTAGRIVHHEERYLPDPKATILFAGYQAAGTLGRLIQDGAKEVSIKDKRIPVRAKVLSIDGFSAHADSDELVEFVEKNSKGLKKVFITMGEIKSSIFLAQRLKDELDVEGVVPERGKRYELDL